MSHSHDYQQAHILRRIEVYPFFLSYLLNLITVGSLYLLRPSVVEYIEKGQLKQIDNGVLAFLSVVGISFVFGVFLLAFYDRTLRVISEKAVRWNDLNSRDKKRLQMWERIHLGTWSCGFMLFFFFLQWWVFLLEDGKAYPGYTIIHSILTFSLIGVMLTMFISSVGLMLVATKHFRE